MTFLKRTKYDFIKTDKSIYTDWANCKTVQGMMAVVDKLPNPDVVLRKSGKGIGVLRNITNHYQVGTCILSRKSGTQSALWKLNDNSCDKKEFDFFNEIFNTLNIHQLINDILDAPLFGYNPIEISYEKDGGYIYPVKLTGKPQEWFYFNSDNEFFFKDKTQNGKRKIDFENGFKFLLPRNNPTYLNPYGEMILSRCFWNVVFSNGGYEFLVKFCEKYGFPYIFGRYGRGSNENEQKSLLESLINMVQDAVGVIPDDSRVEIVPTGSTGSSDIHLGLINKCEQNIAKAILGQTLTTDVGNIGSYAAANSHMSVRADIIDSDKALVETTINDFINKVSLINFNSAHPPVFAFIENEDILQRAEIDNKVAALGVSFSEDYIIRTYGYKKGDIEITQKQTPYNFTDKGNNSGQEKTFIAPETDNILNPDEIERQITPALNEIISMFNKTSNAKEAMEKLAEIYPDFNTKELEETLAKVIFAAELKGRLEAQK